MPGIAWGQKEKRPLTARLLESADAADREGHPDLAAELRTRAQSRAADPQWSVTVKVVGSPKDPRRFDALKAMASQVIHRARVRARKEVTALEGLDAVNDGAVAMAVFRDPEFHTAMGAVWSEWFLHGIDGGEAEAARLYTLGGTEALQDAVHEVRAFNEVTGPLG